MGNMGINVEVKKWGNSLGVILPKEIVKEKDIHENEEIGILIYKKTNINEVFGMTKNWKKKNKMTAQEFKDQSRKEGWN